jgi:uracil-DNA glycosylase
MQARQMPRQAGTRVASLPGSSWRKGCRPRRFVPSNPTISKARAASANCRGCDLWRRATRTVFGAGPCNADIVMVGEQPGDEEDRAGLPFVGPAGRVLDRALEEAGLPRSAIYLTNAVKHFSWEPRGKRRIHKKPKLSEVAACRPWIETEISLINPRALVCLGATATRALLGAKVRVMRDRGKLLESPLAPIVMTTVHPSSILRARTDAARHQAMALLVQDLKTLAAQLSRHPAR